MGPQNPNLIISIVIILLLIFPEASEGKYRPSRETEKETTLEDLEIKSPSANILFDKKFLTNVFAIGWEVRVEYSLYNVGDQMALDVQILDEDFSSNNSKFDVTRGQAEVRIGRIVPGANVTLNLTAIPNTRMTLGAFQFQPAKVSYRSAGEEVSEDDIIGFSSLSPINHGNVDILAQQDANRLYMSKGFELLMLILMCLPTVSVPLLMWKSHCIKYDRLQELSQLIRKSKSKKGNSKTQ